MMKKFTLLAASLFFFAAINAQSVTPTTNPAQAEVKDINKMLAFKGDNYSFGKIPQGKPVEYEVEITNIGMDSIKIENIQVQCGCTTPKYKQNHLYAPGESFKVTLGYNNATSGHFSKSATFYFSGGLTKVVTFSGETYAAPENAAPVKEGVGKIKPGK